MIPGSGGVLRNKLGITTHETLDVAMRRHVAISWSELKLKPIPQRPDLEYLRYIHWHFFSELFEWAGELRKPGDEVMAKGTGIVYARSQLFMAGLDELRELHLKAAASTEQPMADYLRRHILPVKQGP